MADTINKNDDTSSSDGSSFRPDESTVPAAVPNTPPVNGKMAQIHGEKAGTRPRYEAPAPGSPPRYEAPAPSPRAPPRNGTRDMQGLAEAYESMRTELERARKRRSATHDLVHSPRPQHELQPAMASGMPNEGVEIMEKPRFEKG